MIELPEAMTIARQLNSTVRGKTIAHVEAGHTPRKMVWYFGKREEYANLLVGRVVGESSAYGSWVEIKAGEARILLGEGVGIRFHAPGVPGPEKHQLLIAFEDGSVLSTSVQMYGGMGAFLEGSLDNRYYRLARDKASPLSPAFDSAYFGAMASAPEVQKLSLKALLATEQRIPGLGNGVLQDILFSAKMHPKEKVNALSDEERAVLFNSVKGTLSAMTTGGGRDTEADLFGHPGGYKTILSRNTAGKPCPLCGTMIKKEAYLGGSIYFCERCQGL